MRELEDVIVKGMALVRKPANKRRFITTKSEEAAVASDSALQHEAPPAAVSDAIDAIKLSKGEDAKGHELLHTASHLFNGSDLTLQDLMAFGHSLGLQDVAKAASKKDDEDEDEEDGEGDGKMADKKKNPFAKSEIAAPAEQPAPSSETTKPTSATEGEGANMANDAERNNISKSEHDKLVERLAKSEAAVAGFMHKEEMRVEKSANQTAYSALELDHDALADVTLALRKSSKDHAATLERVLKSANEQVRVAKRSDGTPFRPQSIRGGLAKSEQQGISSWKELVKKHRDANPGMSENDAITAVAKSADGLAAYQAAKGNI